MNIEDELDIIETEIFVKNNKCYNFEDNIIIEGYNVYHFLESDENQKLLPKTEYNYPMNFYTHILYGQFRICNSIGGLDVNKEKILEFNNIYKVY